MKSLILALLLIPAIAQAENYQIVNGHAVDASRMYVGNSFTRDRLLDLNEADLRRECSDSIAFEDKMRHQMPYVVEQLRGFNTATECRKLGFR